MRLRKPELIPLLFMICATALLTTLGTWQLQRLNWKNNEIHKIEAAQALPSLGTIPQELNGLDYRHVVLTGTFMHDKAIHMAGRPQGAPGEGYYIVTPLKLDDDGRFVMVNRGFAPLNQETKPEGIQTVSGIIRPLRLKRFFSPENNIEKNVWFYEDMPAMSKATGHDLIPLMIEATGDVQKDVYPWPHDGKISLRNDHMHYAITWFSLAIIGIVMFGFYQRNPKA